MERHFNRSHENSLMARDAHPETGDETPLTPEELRRMYPDIASAARNGGKEGRRKSLFALLVTPPTRAMTLDALVNHPDEALTLSEIAHYNHLSTSAVHEHIDALLSLAVVEEAGKKGNAMTYELNRQHPVAQLLIMIDELFQWGETSMHVDERFLDRG